MAHVDAGKTTVTERILYYTGHIHKLGNVDQGNTVMDSDPREEKRGITISSAAITTFWQLYEMDYQLNIIDTPGHVDFTAEVERSLRVLDGAIAVFCARSGVQPQSETVWRQADKYEVPRIVLINKMDRQGADFTRVIAEIRQMLQSNVIPVQLPIGSEDTFIGIIDLVSMQAWVWQSDDGKKYEVTDIPEAYRQAAGYARSRLLEEVSLMDEEMFERFTTDPATITEDLIHRTLRKATLERSLVPAFCAAAYKNKGIQPLLNAVVRYLPSPSGETGAPFAGLVFKIVSNDYTGKLTLFRVYDGILRTGDMLINSRTGKKVRAGRLMRIMSDKFETVTQMGAGDIGAIIGLKEVQTGDTLSDPAHPVSLESMQFPEPMIGYAIEARRVKDADRLDAALSKLLEEDPTLNLEVDPSSGQTILKGMGELHLEVVLEKIAGEYQLEINKGQPQIAFKETLTQAVFHKEVFKKQNGGSGNFAEIHFELSPRRDNLPGLEFINEVRGGAIPREFIASISEGFEAAMRSGVIAGYPVRSMQVRLIGGAIHEKDSHAQDFEQVALLGFKNAAPKAAPKLLEPVMRVDVTLPEEYTGPVTGDLNRRRGIVKNHAYAVRK